VDFNSPNEFPLQVRTMQIIVVALTMGLVFFLAGVSVVLPGNLNLAHNGLPLITLIGLGFAGAVLVAREIVVRTITASGRRTILRGDSGQRSTDSSGSAAQQLVALYQTRMMVGAACTEGPAFFLLIAYMLERSPWALGAALLLIIGVAAHFPTQQRVTAFVQRQLSLMEEER
jgi:hypothetical protein